MIILLIKLVVVIGFFYNLYERVFKVYYRYFYYKRQGIPISGIPWPVIGTLHVFLKSMKSMNMYSVSPVDHHVK